MVKSICAALSSRPPTSLSQCFHEGRLSIHLYRKYRKQCDCLYYDDNNIYHRFKKFRLRRRRRKNSMNSCAKQSFRARRSVKKHYVLYRDDDDALKRLVPRTTMWYYMYVKDPPRNLRLANLFRLRFRMPHECYIDTLEAIKKNEIFSRWQYNDAVGDHPSELSLLLLGLLRYLGRGLTFDDLYEATAISREVHRVFFRHFVEFGSTVMYNQFVSQPALQLDNSSDKLFKIAGFDGCVGSTDATNIPMLDCPAWATVMHKSFKLSSPARTYNLTTAHTRQILSSTCGHPSTWNDKTLILCDDFATSIRDNKLFNDFDFKLFEEDEGGNIIEVEYSGAWLIVDNGYLYWSCTVPLLKESSSYKFTRFSEWLESMRKDVECTFGILKGRFSIL